MDALIDAGYVDVATFTDGGGGYEWQEMHVYRAPDGQLYAYAASGCSCNCYEENPIAVADLTALPDMDAAQRFWADAIDWNCGLPRWLDEARPVFEGLGLR